MNWKDINIRKGKELYSLETDTFYKDNPLDKLTQQLCIILDKDEEYVDSIPMGDLGKYRKEIEFLSEPPKGSFNKSIKIGKFTYYFIDLNKITLGEFIDLEEYIKDPMENLESIMAILYRKKNEKYKPEIVLPRASIFLENMSYEDAAGVSLFFSLLGMDFIKTTKDSSMLTEMMMDLMKQQQKLKELLEDHNLMQKKVPETNSSGI